MGKAIGGGIVLIFILTLVYAHTATVINTLASYDLFTYSAIFLYLIFVLDVLFHAHLNLALRAIFRISATIFILSILLLGYMLLSKVYASSSTEIFGVQILYQGLGNLISDYILWTTGLSLLVMNTSMLLMYIFDKNDM
ncbi:hypothetical protein H4J56_18265 [Colwellia sp. BRX8-4]|uniref:hypothetical protein n=1 Tax=Colwellia sp. BRX8-4 TaxID=2759836 RepID=UPI0015F6EC07|nr:hypothetical protein [Colwellia sp. BRX8-4]MBA6365223.1 hypothetical protein [Colwellia sp. BRX8-8]MBA6373364.1 hypothetical protein [Colwellia sp. BRX8-4]